ncbi:MAG: hypothetical protein V9F82_01560 [Dermatophilaceae bacterium]
MKVLTRVLATAVFGSAMAVAVPAQAQAAVGDCYLYPTASGKGYQTWCPRSAAGTYFRVAVVCEHEFSGRQYTTRGAWLVQGGDRWSVANCGSYYYPVDAWPELV